MNKSQYIETLRVRTQTAKANALLCEARLDAYRRCNPDVDYDTDQIFKHLNKTSFEASTEFAKLYDELKSLTWGKLPSLADSIKIETQPDGAK